MFASLDKEVRPTQRQPWDVPLGSRPEAPAPPVGQPRALPEPPPPPPPAAVRRDRIRRRSNAAAPAEEPRPMPIMFTIPADGAASAPLGMIIPTQAAVDTIAPPIPNNQQEQIREQSPGLDGPPTPALSVAAPAVPVAALPAPALPALETGRTLPVDAVPAHVAATLPTQGQSIPPQTVRSQGSVAAPIPLQPPGIQAQQPDQTPQVQEVPAETPAAVNQPQPTIQSPEEHAAVGLQPGSREDAPPHLFIINAEPIGQQGPNAAATNAPAAPAAQPARAEPGQGEQHEVHADDENINMMLQGMLQALVEEIVFDAINEERMENTVTDPSPAVSTNATSMPRASSADSSTVRTSTPVTPPPTELQQPPSQPPPDRRT